MHGETVKFTQRMFLFTLFLKGPKGKIFSGVTTVENLLHTISIRMTQ